MAAMISKKNFSILIEFKQREYSRGSLFAVYAGDSLVLEMTSDARDNSLKLFIRGKKW
uniref:Uncharacterized protein n=1 Tax=Romanomermis culicivorax TaxID=13658 RepID=A0A915K1E4_ROMCU